MAGGDVQPYWNTCAVGRKSLLVVAGFRGGNYHDVYSLEPKGYHSRDSFDCSDCFSVHCSSRSPVGFVTTHNCPADSASTCAGGWITFNHFHFSIRSNVLGHVCNDAGSGDPSFPQIRSAVAIRNLEAECFVKMTAIYLYLLICTPGTVGAADRSLFLAKFFRVVYVREVLCPPRSDALCRQTKKAGI